MSTIISKEELFLHYSSGKSMTEVAILMKCSVHKITYWMTKYGIEKRSRSDAMYLKLNPNGDPFKILLYHDTASAFLYGLGIGIYWGEGDKSNGHSVRVANSDPDVIKNFIVFLHKICGIKDEKISFSIVCFNDSKVSEVKMFWAKQLKINPDKFGKIVQIPPQGKGTYKKKSKVGVCTVTVSNIKLKKWIMLEIDKLKANAGMAQW